MHVPHRKKQEDKHTIEVFIQLMLKKKKSSAVSHWDEEIKVADTGKTEIGESIN